MRIKVKIGLACLGLMAVPAVALGGVRPPDDTTYQDGGSVATTTNGGKKVDLGVAIYECGNPVPFSIEGVKVSRKGKYAHSGRTKNVAGDKYDLTVKGEFKSKSKTVQKVTIEKGSCKKSEKITLKAVK